MGRDGYDQQPVTRQSEAAGSNSSSTPSSGVLAQGPAAASKPQELGESRLSGHTNTAPAAVHSGFIMHEPQSHDATDWEDSGSSDDYQPVYEESEDEENEEREARMDVDEDAADEQRYYDYEERDAQLAVEVRYGMCIFCVVDASGMLSC